MDMKHLKSQSKSRCAVHSMVKLASLEPWSLSAYCDFFTELLDGYGRLSQTASDEALRDFLEVIQKNHKQVFELRENTHYV